MILFFFFEHTTAQRVNIRYYLFLQTLPKIIDRFLLLIFYNLVQLVYDIPIDGCYTVDW